MSRTPTIRRALLVALTCCLTAATLPSAASAAAGSVVKDGNTLSWTGVDDPLAGDYVSIYVDLKTASPSDDQLVLYHWDLTFPGGGSCTTTSDMTTNYEVRCPFTEISRIMLDGRAGPDYLEFGVDRPGFVIDARGGAGADYITAYGFGSAVTMRGGPGADFIEGSGAADVLDGEEDNDTLLGYGGGDTFVGGTGFDRVSYSDRGASDPVNVTVDGNANDGTVAINENDNVTGDIEDVSGTPGDDTLVGSAGANSLDGGSGNDTLDGGEGFDSFIGGLGVDLIQARDGNSERIDCGDGVDSAFTDTRDVDSGCETVNESSELEPDRDGDGIESPSDCDDRNPNVRPGGTEVPNNGLDDDCVGGDRRDVDADGDGFFPPQDCNDNNKGQNPNVPEVYGNDVDEDCNLKKDPLLSFTSHVQSSWRKKQGTFRVTTLAILNPAAGATVTVTCKGGRKRGCPFTKRTSTVPAGSRQFDLRSGLRKAKLEPGVTLEIRMLRKDAIGRVTRLKFSKRRDLPTETRLCMAPTDKKPGKC